MHTHAHNLHYRRTLSIAGPLTHTHTLSRAHTHTHTHTHTQVQASVLRRSPEIVVATPGRLIDHLHNTQSVGLEDLAVLVLDEADRCGC